MNGTARRWAIGAVFAAAMTGALALAPEGPVEPATGWGRLPPELAAVLEAKAGGYTRRALRFTCRERIRAARYAHNEARKDSFKDHDYLLISDPAAMEGFSAVRTRPGASGAGAEKVELESPEPYLWSVLFDSRIRSQLHFRTGEWHTTPWRLVIPIWWSSSAPVLDKRRVTEWTGVAEIEYATGNLVRVVATPMFQEERMNLELERFLTAFRILGLSTVKPPTGLELTIDFDFEHEGFTYPTRSELETFRLLHHGIRETVLRQVVEYSDYRFFGTKVEDHIPPLLWQPPAELQPPSGPAHS